MKLEEIRYIMFLILSGILLISSGFFMAFYKEEPAIFIFSLFLISVSIVLIVEGTQPKEITSKNNKEKRK